MEAVSQTGTRVSAPPRMSSHSPGTKLTFGHEAPLDVRSPRLAASTPTIGRPGSSHHRLRPFPFHPDVSRPAARQVNYRGVFSCCDRGGECNTTRNRLTRGLI